MISFLHMEGLFQDSLWRRDLALAPLFSIFMTLPLLHRQLWLFCALYQWDITRSTLMDVSRIDWRAIRTSLGTTQDSASGHSPNLELY